MKIALDAAKGLTFLHVAEPKVIYRDFKSYNILLDSSFNAKVSDFGLARDGPTGDKSHVSTRVMGTYGYAAPEYLATAETDSSMEQAQKAAKLTLQCISSDASARPTTEEIVSTLEQLQRSEKTRGNPKDSHPSPTSTLNDPMEGTIPYPRPSLL